MMRNNGKMWLALVLAAVLCACGSAAMADEGHTHYAKCTAPGVCAVCGETGDYELKHPQESLTAVDMKNGTHAYQCSQCEEMLEGVYPHSAPCDAKDVRCCAECGSMDNNTVIHDDAHIKYVDNGNAVTHTAKCPRCDKVLAVSQHTVDCTAADHSTCQYCGSKGNIVREHSKYSYKDNGNGMHTITCQVCNEVVNTGLHMSSCDSLEPGQCNNCGAKMTRPADHQYDQYVDNGDGTHTAVCSKCGAKGESDEGHYVLCSSPNHRICAACGAKGSVEVYHMNIRCFDNGDGTHVAKCIDCSHVEYSEEHFTTCKALNTAVCSECGAASKIVVLHCVVGKVCAWCGRDPSSGDFEIIMRDGMLGRELDGVFVPSNGVVTYNGGRFLVRSGVIQTDVSGLHNENGTWYYFANGQAQTGYSGFVEYDGAWFYVINGRMNPGTNGIYNYDGSKFLVSAGKVRYDYSGLFQNAAATVNNPDGKWYFIASGQIATYYTGLAEYDNAWFYLINGVLAENYTGTVEYDGAEFNVVNGMVVK